MNRPSEYTNRSQIHDTYRTQAAQFLFRKYIERIFFAVHSILELPGGKDLTWVTVGQQAESSPGLTVTVIVTMTVRKVTVGQQAESSPWLTVTVIVTMTVRKVAVTADLKRVTVGQQA